jgi:hypothetical protein
MNTFLGKLFNVAENMAIFLLNFMTKVKATHSNDLIVSEKFSEVICNRK